MKRLDKIFVLLILKISLTSSIVIEVQNGLIEGTILRSRKGENFYAFRKIPYAEPPIGDLRFKAPVEKGKWEGVLNGTEYGPRCTQVYMTRYGWPKEMHGMVDGEEDCLTLNVFSKSLSTGSLKPVIVWIHGGGFEIGASFKYAPDLLMDRDVVVVSINYRLGPFGFLALGTPDAVGNYGLKDQTLALKWIQKNIQRFDGDPNLVTITGCSAGGYSTTAHMASEMSQGLFHKVIATSGAITWQVQLDNHLRSASQKLASSVGCPTNINTMIDCLKTKTAEEISKAGLIEFFDCPIIPWVPVVEPDFGQERFLKDDPNNLFSSGNFTKVPVIAGITDIEFAETAASILTNPINTKALNDDFIGFGSRCFFFEDNGKRSVNQMGEALRNLYFPFVERIERRNFNGLLHLAADGVIGYNVHRFVHFASKFTNVYYYKVSFPGRWSVFNFPRDKPYGVHHADDMHYIFTTNYVGPQIQQSDPENIMVERLTRIWENFAKTGNPNNSTDEYLSDMKWPKHNISDEFYLDIGQFMIEKQGLFLERYAVWDSFEVAASGRLEVGWLMMSLMVLKFIL